MAEDIQLIDTTTGQMLQLGWMDDIIDFTFPHKTITVIFKVTLKQRLLQLPNGAFPCGGIGPAGKLIVPSGTPFELFGGCTIGFDTTVAPFNALPSGVTVTKPPKVSPTGASFPSWTAFSLNYGGVNDPIGFPFPPAPPPSTKKTSTWPLYSAGINGSLGVGCYYFADEAPFFQGNIAGGYYSPIFKSSSVNINAGISEIKLKKQTLRYKSSLVFGGGAGGGFETAGNDVIFFVEITYK